VIEMLQTLLARNGADQTMEAEIRHALQAMR
jgi:hypothetical protein